MRTIVLVYVLPIMIIVLGIYLSFWTQILKDATRNRTKANKPYSFSRAQLMWWTLIISSTFLAYYGYNNEVLKLNDSCLILLGISLATTTSAKIIDNNDIMNNIPRHQDQNVSYGFLIDILSDENGISVHRFQALVFNLIFGIIFIVKFCSTGQVDDFNSNSLVLMGISSAAYIGLKLNENHTLPRTGDLNTSLENPETGATTTVNTGTSSGTDTSNSGSPVQNTPLNKDISTISDDDDLQDIDESYYTTTFQNFDN